MGIVTLIVLGRKGPRGFPFRRPHLMRKPLKKQGWPPTRITTDKLRSYHVAIRTLGLTAYRGTKPPYQVSSRGFTTDIFGLSHVVMR